LKKRTRNSFTDNQKELRDQISELKQTFKEGFGRNIKVTHKDVSEVTTDQLAEIS